MWMTKEREMEKLYLKMVHNCEGNGKINYRSGYYIGQIKNYFPNGNGIVYDKNGNIIYEGDFVEGNYEGDGKLIYENESYYIGQFKKKLPNGKGKQYDKSGNIKYEGDYVDGKREGNGKAIFKAVHIIKANLKII